MQLESDKKADRDYPEFQKGEGGRDLSGTIPLLKDYPPRMRKTAGKKGSGVERATRISD